MASSLLPLSSLSRTLDQCMESPPEHARARVEDAMSSHSAAGTTVLLNHKEDEDEAPLRRTASQGVEDLLRQASTRGSKQGD